MASLQPVRGTHDLLPDEARRARHVTETGRTLAERYGYEEAATPIFEFSEVFARTLGETSDIVTKEMYTFTDKGGDEITLRPEGTAGIARALISGGLSQNLPLKFFYSGPMFRYERPQKGRLRQFHQIGVELLGVAEPVGDIEVIALGAAILDALGVQGNTTLELNTLGNTDSRTAYRDVLVEYFGDHRGGLSEDSLTRLERNPLRILDSKNEGDRAIVVGAPEFDDSLDAESRDFFAEVCADQARRAPGGRGGAHQILGRRWGSPGGGIRGLSAGSIITAIRHSNSRPMRSVPKARFSQAAAMMVLLDKWAVRRPRGSDGRRGSNACAC